MKYRLGVAGAFLVAALIGGGYLSAAPSHAADCVAGRSLSIVAHPDDDLVFQNPDIMHDIHAEKCVETVYVTAADDGKGIKYAKSRQKGVEAAYAAMAQVPNVWIPNEWLSDGRVTAVTLEADPKINLRFMWLPDGDPLGSGLEVHQYESLEKLWNGDLPKIHVIDSKQSYTKATLIGALRQVMEQFQPNLTRTLDYTEPFGADYSSYAPDWDHSDHLAVARFAQAAHQTYLPATGSNTLSAYVGSGTGDDLNLAGADLAAKQTIFYTYSSFDTSTGCSSELSCGVENPYPRLLRREHLSDTDITKQAPPKPQPKVAEASKAETELQLRLNGRFSTP